MGQVDHGLGEPAGIGFQFSLVQQDIFQVPFFRGGYGDPVPVVPVGAVVHVMVLGLLHQDEAAAFRAAHQ